MEIWSFVKTFRDSRHFRELMDYLRGPGAISYGSVIRLVHDATECALHSHAINCTHPGSSNQQQVTAFQGCDPNDHWIVRGPHGYPETYRKGKRVKASAVIRLEHRNTTKNLHSHKGFPSPVSGQQEVTGFGLDGVGDKNDNWQVEVEDAGVWRAETKVRLIHQATKVALHSHRDIGHPEYTRGQQEVTGFASRDENDWWRAVIVRDLDAP